MAGYSMKNCPKCGNVFTFIKNPICPDCQEEEDQIFETVRRYLKDNGDKTLEEVAEATEVSVKKILKFIKDGRIDISTNTSISYACDGCGKPITSGSYCPNCATKIKNKFSNNFTKAPTPSTSKPKSVMYTQQNK